MPDQFVHVAVDYSWVGAAWGWLTFFSLFFATHIGQQKRAGFAGFCCALFLGPLGVIVAGFLDNRPRCRNCGGRVDDVLFRPRVCEHCDAVLRWDEKSLRRSNIVEVGFEAAAPKNDAAKVPEPSADEKFLAANRPAMMKRFAGKVALVSGAKLVAVFDTEVEAADAAEELCNGKPFLIHWLRPPAAGANAKVAARPGRVG